jgi:putative ABC transport system permease protein
LSIWESILVAMENLRINKLRSFLTIIGIVVGVGAVVTVVSIGEAGKSSIVSEISQYGAGFFQVYPNFQDASVQNDIEITMRDVDQISKLEGIQTVTGIVSLQMQSKLGKETLSFSVTASTSDLVQQDKIDIVAGRFFSGAEERARQRVSIVDSAFSAKFFGSTTGALNQKIPLGGKVYRIIGIFKKPESLLSGIGGETFNAYMPIQSLPNAADNIRVDYVQASTGLDDTQHVADIMLEVKQLLAKRHNTEVKSYISITAEESQDQISSIFNILQTIIGSIAGISLLVGGIGVMNIMLVSVTERTREIGIRKAIGATPGAIMGQFIIEAVILSFLGGFIGAVLGLGGAFIFAMLTGWPFLVSWWAMLLAFVFSAAVGIFFGLYPANKAAKLQPIEALRYE